jgi:hypothetical protein
VHNNSIHIVGLDVCAVVNISDKTALPCPDDGEVAALWFMSTGQEHSPKLEGSLVGEVCSSVG